MQDIEMPEQDVVAVAQVELTDDSSFDLEAIAANYEGRSKIVRLLFIAKRSAPLLLPALTLALQTIQSSTLDVPLYESTFANYQEALDAFAKGLVKDPIAIQSYEATKHKLLSLDRAWIDKATKEAKLGREKLEVELKGYTNNLIKESIRMGHRDLAMFLYRTGDLQGAIRSYTKSREFCTSSQHILEMCLGVIEVALEMSNYPLVRNYVVKAESALEALSTVFALNGKSKPAATNMPGMVAPGANPADAAKEKERASVAERLRAATGVASLGSGTYNRAAKEFTSLGRETLGGPQNHFIPPADIALYAVMTGLATFSRTELRTRLLENADLRPMLDLEPYLRDILRAFYESKFQEGLRLINHHRVRQQLDLHLASHVASLLPQIESRALLSYFAPFTSVSLSRMSLAFGWKEDYTKSFVIRLIQNGEMKARIDNERGMVVATNVDGRKEAFRKTIEEGVEIQRKAEALSYRMKLMRADILVKGPRAAKDQIDT